MEGANQKSFDVFVRNYDDNKSLITLTVTGDTTIGKLKKLFAEQCKCKNRGLFEKNHEDLLSYSAEHMV